MTLPYLGFFSLKNIDELREPSILLVGVPYEGKKETKKGSKKAPDIIRKMSYNFSGVSASFDFTNYNLPLYDIGNIDPIRNKEEIKKIWSKNQETNSKIIAIGGDHLITYHLLKQAIFSDKTAIIWIDAHADLATEYPQGVTHSHATVFYNLHQELNFPYSNMMLIGGHAYTQSNDEFSNIQQSTLRHISTKQLVENEERALNDIDSFVNSYDNIFLSIDLDILDQSFVPTLSCPEPFGLIPQQLIKILARIVKNCTYVDVVEARVERNNMSVARIVDHLIFYILEQWQK